MNHDDLNRVERSIELRAPRSRVCSLKAYLQHGINLRLGKPADHVA